MKNNSDKTNTNANCITRTIILFFSLLLITHAGWAQKNKKEPIYYSTDGVSYTIDKNDWKITDEQAINGDGFVATFETPEDKSTGVVTTTWLNIFMDRNETLAIHKKHMRRSGLYREAGIQFSIPDTVALGRHKAIHIDYLTQVDGNRIEGKVYCLNSGLKTVTIFFQTSGKEREKNNSRFIKLLETFGVRED